ncbi:2,5-diamino-6-ribosylamino-4(3H)-pyrimidinone 5'-phosphate reductase [[Candida] anglica]
MSSLVPLPQSLVPVLEPYFPTDEKHHQTNRPFVTLTYAQSIDARIAAAPGTQTKISHQETKTMTHYIRSRHQAIMVGIGTVLADDPKLNCRYPGALESPRPIVLDPHGKWEYHTSQLQTVCENGLGLAPYIVVDSNTTISEKDREVVLQQGGLIVKIPIIGVSVQSVWTSLFEELVRLNIKSIMIEGGATIINDLLMHTEFVDSLIITIGPVFLGKSGVEVSPSASVNFKNVKWWTGVQDSVMCATP